MKKMKPFENLKYIDGLRFISRLNTQVRTLVTVSQIVKILGTKSLPKQFLREALQKWSAQEENVSIEYKNHRGKVTKGNGKPTTAFNHYLDFSVSLKVITAQNHIIMNSRLGRLLSKLASEDKEIESQLNEAEKFFYLINLFHDDADALLLTLELLESYDIPVPQKSLLDIFEEQLKQRLLLKQKYAHEQLQAVIHNKYQEIEYTWKNAKSYAKHIIPPRLEWLKDLGILTQTKEKSWYQLTELGKDFYTSLPMLNDSKKRDVNERWFKKNAMASFAPLVLSKCPLIFWHELDSEQQHEFLAPVLKNAFRLLDVEVIRRISLYPSLLLMSISIASKNNVIVEFQELEDKLKQGVTIENKMFSARPSARMNEGYITLNII
jgi:hypothetical protein